MAEKKDPHNHKRKFEKWKKASENGIEGVSKANSELIKDFIFDMEHGLNVSVRSKKGPRSYIRLNTLRDKLMFFTRTTESLFKLQDISKISEKQIHQIISGMRKGEITKQNGKPYQSTGYFVKNFKTFWHWLMLVRKKQGEALEDITIYLDSSVEKHKWTYLTEHDVKKLCNRAKFKYKALMLFLFDTGIRAPTELSNVLVSDLNKDYSELHIRDEISKIIGRKIKLMLCPEILKEHIKENHLSQEDYLFKISPSVTNQYLKRLAKKVLGDNISSGGKRYSELTLYDFRHSSACYWLPRYKQQSALQYRFGWKKNDKVFEYTDFLGLNDTITEEDLMLDISITEHERRLKKTEQEKKLLQERVQSLETQMKQILERTEVLAEMMTNQKPKKELYLINNDS